MLCAKDVFLRFHDFSLADNKIKILISFHYRHD